MTHFVPNNKRYPLVKCLIDRTRKISSEKFIFDDLAELKSIFLSNGYPSRLLDKLFSFREKEIMIGPQKCPVYLKLPWIGQISESHFEKSLKNIIQKTFYSSKLRCIFSTKSILPSTPKDSLPALLSSNVVYEFKCECGARYVGRTSQRLGERIKQHIPSTIRNKPVPTRQQPKRACHSKQEITCSSAIGKHLLENGTCAEAYSDTQFRVLAKCRTLMSLRIKEAIYIKLSKPPLCRQKEFVFKLSLF